MKTIIQETDFFRLILTKSECLAPKGLYCLEMTQEQIQDGEVIGCSTYQFFLNEQNLINLSEELIR